MILPVLNNDVSLPNVGSDWVFIYLTLCGIVNPQNYFHLKKIILAHVDEMYKKGEPNILDYYDRLDVILYYLENNVINL